MKTKSVSASLAVRARTISTTRHLSLRHACLWTGFLAFATIAFGPGPAQAAVTEAWVQRYRNVASSTTDRAVKVVRDAAGDIIVAGSTAGGFPGVDMLTIKYSGADGSVHWQQRYNSPENGDDRFSALAVDGSGNVVVTGVIAGSGGNYAYTAKYAAADGALLWEKRYWSDLATAALALDASGNVLVTGSSSSVGDPSGRYFTAKYAAADGALLWEKHHDGPAETSALAVDGSGNVAVTGVAYNRPDGSLSDTDSYTALHGQVCGGGRRPALGKTLQRPGEQLRFSQRGGGGCQR